MQLFVTPPGGISFGWHYDAEDVVILQTGGSKDYNLRANTLDQYARSEPDFSKIREETSPLALCTLVEGDMLYLPRGHWHVARARTCALSISIGVS